jgi:hypothetical protein
MMVLKAVLVRVLVEVEMSNYPGAAHIIQDFPGMNYLGTFGVTEELGLSVHCCSDLTVSDLEVSDQGWVRRENFLVNLEEITE